jgi:hypothetical protein
MFIQFIDGKDVGSSRSLGPWKPYAPEGLEGNKSVSEPT